MGISSSFAIRYTLIEHEGAGDLNINSDAPRLQSAKWGLRSTFFFLGMSVSVATARMAEIKGHTHSSDAAFGYALIVGNLGIMLGNYIGGHAVHRIGSKTVIRLGVFGIASSQLGYGIADQLWQISVIAFIAGAFGAFSTVAVNMQGGMLESSLGRSLLPTFHGSWTAGAFAASLVASVVSGHISLHNHLLVNCIFTFIVVSTSALFLLPASSDYHVLSRPENQSETKTIKSKLDPALILVALGSCLAIISESSVADWSAILLHEKLQFSISQSALGFAFFALGQITGRFTVGKRIDRVGISAVIRIGGLIGGFVYLTGLALAHFLANSPPMFLLSFMLVQYFVLGLCIAPMPPAFAILAYRIPNMSSAKALAQIQMISALGFLFGRVILSTITNLFTLQVALIFPAVTLISAGILANRIAKLPNFS